MPRNANFDPDDDFLDDEFDDLGNDSLDLDDLDDDDDDVPSPKKKPVLKPKKAAKKKSEDDDYDPDLEEFRFNDLDDDFDDEDDF